MAKIERNNPRLGRRGALLFAALSGWSLLPGSVKPADEEERPVIVVPRISGRELFQNCVLCHKYDGRGGPSEGGYAADLRVTKLTHQEVVDVITNGRMSKGMPPFNGILDESKIETLATFIKEDLKLKQ
jgi:mono/diheme cytochrome c family protein